MKGSALSLLVVLVISQYVDSQRTIWSIGFGADWGAHEYRNADGFLAGFGPDLMDAVCQEGGIDCRIVLTPYPDCFQSNPTGPPSGGRALLSGWVDGCAAWVVTLERIHVYTFTNPWIKNRVSYLYTRRDDNDFNVDNLSSLQNKRFGFLNGWSTSEQCLSRELTPLKKAQVEHRDTTPEILDLLLKREIDAVFNTEYGWNAEQLRQVKRVNKIIYCSIRGTGMMTRKDSALAPLFNVGFNKFKNSGRFAKFCKDTNMKHMDAGNPIDCIE